MRTAESREVSFLLSLAAPRGTREEQAAGRRKKAQGSHLPKAEPESAAARERAAFLCLRGRGAGALCLRFQPGARRASCGRLRTAARGSGSGRLSGPGPGPRRPALSRGSAPAGLPPPTRRPQHLPRRRARGGDRPWAAGGGCLPRAPGALPPASPGRSAALFRGARSVDRPS